MSTHVSPIFLEVHRDPAFNRRLRAIPSRNCCLVLHAETGRYVYNGDVTGLGIAATERSPMLPSVPTYAEAGYPGLSAASWTGFFAPAGTPGRVLSKLNSEINAIFEEPEIAKRIENAGLQTTIRSRAETATMFRTEIVNWSKMVQAVGVPTQ